MEGMADCTEAKKPSSCHFAQRWWCAQGVTTPKTGHPPGRRGQKWIPALGGSLALLIVLGLAIAGAIKREGPPGIMEGQWHGTWHPPRKLHWTTPYLLRPVWTWISNTVLRRSALSSFFTMEPIPSTSTSKRAASDPTNQALPKRSNTSEDLFTPRTYTVSRITARVNTYRSYVLVQLRQQDMDFHDNPRDVTVTLTPAELDVLCSTLPQAERLLQENSRLKRGRKPKRLMMEALSTPNDGRLRYLEVSIFSSKATCSVRRYFVNIEGLKCPSTDGVTLKLPGMSRLRRLMPMLREDVLMASKQVALDRRHEEEIDRLIREYEESQGNVQVGVVEGAVQRPQGRVEDDPTMAGPPLSPTSTIDLTDETYEWKALLKTRGSIAIRYVDTQSHHPLCL